MFGVRDATDTAIPVVRALRLDHPDLDIDLVVDARLYGANLKVSNLINMEPFIRHPLVVLADSDVAVRPDYLRTVTADLARPEIGFVTCAFVGRPTGNFWSRFTAMSIDYHFLPSVAFGLRLKLAKPCFGPTIAMRRSTLERIGGFRPFVDHLADDFEIGRRIRALGFGFVVPPAVIGHGCPERSAHSMASHELRWARTIQVIDPLSYLGSAVCHPLPWALLGAVLLRGAATGDAALAAVLLSRTFLAGRVGPGGWWAQPRPVVAACPRPAVGRDLPVRIPGAYRGLAGPSLPDRSRRRAGAARPTHRRAGCGTGMGGAGPHPDARQGGRGRRADEVSTADGPDLPPDC